MDFAKRVYGAASHVSGMLTSIVITPVAGGASYSCKVGYFAPTSMNLGGEVIASEPSIKFAAADYPLIGKGDTVVVGSITSIVASVELLHDGSEKQAMLRIM